jgi:putative protease
MCKYANRANEVHGAIFSDIGFLNLIKTKKIGDYPLNITNSFAASQYRQMGFDEITYSVENKLEDIKNMEDSRVISGNVLVHGYVRTMISEHCPVSANNCVDTQETTCSGLCKGKEYFLVDRMEKEHRLITNKLCQSIVFNSDIMYNADRILEFKRFKVKSIRIDGIFINAEELIKVINGYANKFKLNKSEVLKTPSTYTRGHYYKGIE